MARVYALLAAVDVYEPPISSLHGCRNDVERAREFLKARVSGEYAEELLLDAAVKRDDLVEAFRTHLGRAGPDDVALFWFSGHGAQQRVADELWHLEPSGLNQTLVCADSRRSGVADLADKELSVLLDAVAAKAGHTAVVLDCCHSGGGTREPLVSFRGLDQIADAPAVAAYLPEVAALARGAAEEAPTVAGSATAHVALSACRSSEKAKEQLIGIDVHGVFSHSLLTALETLGPGATYRQALAGARARVESLAGQQSPGLYPADLGAIADQPFLGGRVTRPAAAFSLRHLPRGWEVDAGRCHGIPAPDGDPVILEALTAPGETAGGRLAVIEVEPAVSLVKPMGWKPDTTRIYPVVVASVPQPPAAIVLGGTDDDDAAALARVEQAIARAGPGATPSPHVRIALPREGSVGLRLRVAAIVLDGAPVLRILRGDGSPATADVAGHDEASAALVVARLEHIARWTLIKELENPASGIAGAVAIEVVEAQPGEATAPRDRPALAPDEHGVLRLAYRRTGGRLEPPSIFIRLRNAAERPLWCVLLDLTDRFRAHPKLFPGAFVGAGRPAAALEGRPVPVTLPTDRELRPGARVTDHFKLIAADREFSSLAYELPKLDEPPSRGLRDAGDEAPDDDEPPAGGDWTTSILQVVTEVPEE